MVRTLKEELADLARRMSATAARGPAEILGHGLSLEGWLSRAKDLGGAWQEELAREVRSLDEGVRAGASPAGGLERLMRLIIRASEILDAHADAHPLSGIL